MADPRSLAVGASGTRVPAEQGAVMQGQILDADHTARNGTILGDDGNRYRFESGDWRPADPPVAGLRVDFVATDGAAHEIFALPVQPRPGVGAIPGTPGTPVPPPVRSGPAPNNSQVLGWIGIACLFIGFIIPILPTIAAFILGLIGADSAKRHRDSTGLVLSRIAWIGALALVVCGILLLTFAFAFIWPMLQTMIETAMKSAADGSTTRALLSFGG